MFGTKSSVEYPVKEEGRFKQHGSKEKEEYGDK